MRKLVFFNCLLIGCSVFHSLSTFASERVPSLQDIEARLSSSNERTRASAMADIIKATYSPEADKYINYIVTSDLANRVDTQIYDKSPKIRFLAWNTVYRVYREKASKKLTNLLLTHIKIERSDQVTNKILEIIKLTKPESEKLDTAVMNLFLKRSDDVKEEAAITLAMLGVKDLRVVGYLVKQIEVDSTNGSAIAAVGYMGEGAYSYLEDLTRIRQKLIAMIAKSDETRERQKLEYSLSSLEFVISAVEQKKTIAELYRQTQKSKKNTALEKSTQQPQPVSETRGAAEAPSQQTN